MSSNKSEKSNNPTISSAMFKDLVDKDREINILKTQLKKHRSRCKIIWVALIKLNEKIDNFDSIYGDLDEKQQERLFERLEKETKTIYDKYIECGEIDDDLEYKIEDLIDRLKKEYNIVKSSSHGLSMYAYGPESKINREIRKTLKSKGYAGKYSIKKDKRSTNKIRKQSKS